MLTLNQATLMTKNVAKWSSIALGALILLFIIFRIGVLVKNIVAPTPPPPPTVSFGKLPEIEFPQSTNTRNYSYAIDTATGQLPEFPDRAKVYKIFQEQPDLLALKKTSEKIDQRGFTTGPVRIQDNTYQWSDPNSDIGSRISIDIFTSNFSISSSYLGNQNILSRNSLPSPSDAKTFAQTFLSGMSLLPEDLNLEDDQSPIFYSIQNSQLVPTTSFANAHIIGVNFFQKDKDKLPIYYPNPTQSTMKLFIGGGRSFPQVVEASFFHQKISDDSGTYPIKTPDELFSQLKEGKAYIASEANTDDILIQEVLLAYYSSDKKQDYLMPIIVFKGTDGFTAYVSAVKDEWISK